MTKARNDGQQSTDLVGVLDDEALFVLSPWYGVLEILGPPGDKCWWGTECWNGSHVSFLVTATLRPLTPAAAAALGRAPGDLVWDEDCARAWENEPLCG